jgi:probable rRNA maturation factor
VTDKARVEVVWQSDAVPPVDLDRLRNLLEEVLLTERASGEVTAILTGDDELHRLNQEYRGVNAPTDVLSFDLRDDASPGQAIGEIYISIDRAGAQASDRNGSLSDEVDLLSVHGVLHLLGYDHDTDEAHGLMRGREQRHLGEERPA